ncbi:DUF6415 family natural product biosynthesis protein [Streptomyces sp. NPDC091377]|uniref:DUF6415 family natural product biosynthesis protein n=1 Tax=Streptomyces sp. NPDC091377 TaxID=3365995 RepID=UPI003809AABC
MTNRADRIEQRPPGPKMTIEIYKVAPDGTRLSAPRAAVVVPYGNEPLRDPLGPQLAPCACPLHRGAAHPVDLAGMRETARALLGPDAPPADAHRSAALIDTLHAHLDLLVPEVERLARGRDVDSIPRYCALVCVSEAGRKRRARPGPGAYGAAAHARRLARALVALCGHYESLRGHPSPVVTKP